MEKKYCSLTFDDGPNNEGDDTMSLMLDILAKHGIRASFFLIGNKITEKNKAVIKRAFDMGCDIENHSWNHYDMKTLTAEQIREEYERTDEAIIGITGKKPELFRPPYISVSQTMLDTITTPFIRGHGCDDWIAECTADMRYEKMMSKVEDGIMYLLHVNDGNDATLEVVDRAVPALKSQGFEFVTAPELFVRKGIKMVNDGSLWTIV